MNQSKTMAITRPVGEGSDTAEFVRKIGWEPFIVHTVELKPYDKSAVKQMLDYVISKGPVDWLVLMSRNGVHFLFEALGPSQNLIRPSTRIVAVGPKTLETLRAHGVGEATMPDDYSSTGVAKLLGKEPLVGKRIILARSSDADDALAGLLEAQGGSVETVKLYESSIPSDPERALEFIKGLRQEDRFQAVLFTSAIAADNMFRIASGIMSRQELVERLSSMIIGAIGPITEQKLFNLGVKPIVPDRYMINEAAKMISEAYQEIHSPRILH